MNPIANENDFAAIQSALTDHLLGGGTLKEVYGTSPEELEALYVLGTRLYTQGQYLQSAQVFGYLMRIDHFERRYYKAAASALQMMKSYPQAIDAWAVASYLDIDDPEPFFHTAECLLALGKREEARQGFAICVASTKDQTEWSSLHERAEALLTLLNEPGAAS